MKDIQAFLDTPSRNSNLKYITGYYCIDPIVCIIDNDKTIGWFPATEYEKAKIKSKCDIVYNLNNELQNIRKHSIYGDGYDSIIIDYCISNNINTIIIPPDFPVQSALTIQKAEIQFTIEDTINEKRIIKTPKELQYIRHTTRQNCAVMEEVKLLLADSSIGNDNKLYLDNEVLTSEYIQNFIIKSLFDKNCLTDSVIVAIGDQGCMPHEYGSGDVYANTSIIVDIYPKHRVNQYYSDITRTFCKGKPKDELLKLYNTVLEVQLRALEKVHARENAEEIHKFITQFFIDKGYKTGIIDNKIQGFIHGTGHGLGLDCHEAPYISTKEHDLPENSVVTVEPGLYYFGIGGVRIEDLCIVRNTNAEVLTNVSKDFIIE